MSLLLLAAALFLLLLAVGRGKGLRTMAALSSNALFLVLFIFLCLKNVLPLPASLVIAVLITAVNIPLNCKRGRQRLIAFISVLSVLLLLAVLLFWLMPGTHIRSFPKQDYPGIAGMDLLIGIDFIAVVMGVVLLSLIGTVLDTSVAIASFMAESDRYQPSQTFSQRFRSAMSVGGDILGTTINTLFYAFLGGGLSMALWYTWNGWTFGQAMNDTLLARELFLLLFCILGSVFCIPLTSAFGALYLSRGSRLREEAAPMDQDGGAHFTGHPDRPHGKPSPCERSGHVPSGECRNRIRKHRLCAGSGEHGRHQPSAGQQRRGSGTPSCPS